jgi:peptide/nickel transport system permease protein
MSTLAISRPRRRDWPPLIPLAVVLVLVICALFAPLLAPRSPVEGSLGVRLIAPFDRADYLLGTDRHGRDTTWAGGRTRC